jgi:hypothetical protein
MNNVTQYILSELTPDFAADRLGFSEKQKRSFDLQVSFLGEGAAKPVQKAEGREVQIPSPLGNQKKKKLGSPNGFRVLLCYLDRIDAD